MSHKLLTKPGEKRLAVNDFKFRIPQVLLVQLIVVELIAAHLLDHYSFQVYQGFSFVLMTLEVDGVGLILNACHFKCFFYGWSVLFQGAS